MKPRIYCIAMRAELHFAETNAFCMPHKGQVKQTFMAQKLSISFSVCFGLQKNRLILKVHLSTHNIGLG